MAKNINKTDSLHRQFPEHFNTRKNANWKALIEAIGEEDQFIADLAEAVRQQFFVKTANRPYLDRLGSNIKVDRPRFVGMDDPTYRRYIPILAYQPKQVKLIVDTLLDIFFFKESTTAYIESEAAEPFNLEDGWQLEYTVDGIKTERIQFNADDFTDISNATAEEIVSAINRQANESFAIVFNNSVTKEKTVRLFTNTIGSKGSVEIVGGRANIELQFDGFIENAGNGNDTEWTITKVGDTVTFEHTGGNAPGIQFLTGGDIVIIDIAGNEGSFVIESVNIANNTFTFTNLFATAGVFTQTSDRQVKFIRPFKSVVYTRSRRAVTWETSPGEITVEMPTSPPVVRRSLKGSAHINGENSLVLSRVSDTELQLEDASEWPNSGVFWLQVRNNIVTKIDTPSETTVTDFETDSRIQGFDQKYTYTSKSGNNLVGISPALPELAAQNEVSVDTAVRNVSNIMTVTVLSPHDFKVGDYVILSDLTSMTVDDLNGAFEVTEVVSDTIFKVFSFGVSASYSGGTARIERLGMANSGSLAILRTAQESADTDIIGPYIWDEEAAFVLSSKTGQIGEEIKAGQIKKTLQLGSNTIPAEAGEVIFDFGTENQEGPVRYLFKPSDGTIAMDPAYIFQKDHASGSGITMINRRGPHTLSGNGAEYAPYITDTAVAREILQELILEAKSVGIFVDFLIRYPEQLYATLDVYRSGIDPG